MQVDCVNAGPTEREMATESSALSAKSNLANSRPQLMISTKRKPADETTTLATNTTTGAAAAGMTSKVMPKSSVKSRLGGPVSSDSGPVLMISTKGRLADEPTSVAANAAAAATGSTAKSIPKSSVKSRLGAPVTCDSEPTLMIPTKRKLTVTVDGMQSKTAKQGLKSSLKARLGEPATSESQPLFSRRLATTAVDDDDDDDDDDDKELGHNVSANYKTVFSRLGPSQV